MRPDEDTGRINEFDRAYEEAQDGLKTEINEFLFRRLPSDCTISDMDDVAMLFVKEVSRVWEDHDPRK